MSKLYNWAIQHPVVLLVAAWGAGGYLLNQFAPREFLVAGILFAITCLYLERDDHRNKMERARSFLEDLRAGTRLCDVCQFEDVKVPPEILFSEVIITCPACDQQYCPNGAMPPHIGIEAHENRRKVLLSFGLR